MLAMGTLDLNSGSLQPALPCSVELFHSIDGLVSIAAEHRGKTTVNNRAR